MSKSLTTVMTHSFLLAWFGGSGCWKADDVGRIRRGRWRCGASALRRGIGVQHQHDAECGDVAYQARAFADDADDASHHGRERIVGFTGVADGLRGGRPAARPEDVICLAHVRLLSASVLAWTGLN